MKLQFLGAAGTVTGSRYLLSHGSTRLLVDAGLFQGFKNLRLKNWDGFPPSAESLDAVLLTHAHLDHSGYLPVLVRKGFRGPIFATRPTIDLCGILLPDSGYLQEEEAKFANKRGYSKHNPALPLYTVEDAEYSLSFFKPIHWRKSLDIAKQGMGRMAFEFFPAGHLLGAASILVRTEKTSVAFSGDLGRRVDALVREPAFDTGADYLVVESTYGNRKHTDQDPKLEFKEIIQRTIARQGVLLIPSFAVGRAQLILYYLLQLRRENALPADLPIYLNSPMAAQANRAFASHLDELRIDREDCRAIFEMIKVVGSVQESKALNERKDPAIIIAASGMATGGRVLHHLKSLVSDSRNTILFVGFQAGGTRGDSMVRGAREIKIHGEYWPVHAEVVNMETLSAHADADGIMDWIRQLKQKPKRIFVTHGEPEAADGLRRRIWEELKIEACVPEFGEEVEL